MLRLNGISKVYKVADTEVQALKGVNLSFRPHEFVSILGPSGCGKTTMLNIIGGLDKYTSGDLFIDGISTKKYKEHDWDVYRNHRIGFIFQSYNLIPHQTILSNVELALTISGYTKQERTEKAKKTLDRVGLAGQYNKRPNQLSGGQCQRVAIARALVNDPEILLADEPTGALDTTTSVQIMNLIQEISQEKLIIMVTHNPELAYKYSSRIVKILDGKIENDSNPYSEEEEKNEYAEEQRDNKSIKQINKKRRKADVRMSPFTAFRLSAHNLWSKKGRTILTSLAGSIGIIGVSLVLAISSGITNYIGSIQNDLLSGNPITISETTYDLEALTDMMSMEEKAEMVREGGRVYIDETIEKMMKSTGATESIIKKNKITDEYIHFLNSMSKDYYAAIIKDYGIELANNIYTNYKSTQTDLGNSTSVTGIRTVCLKLVEEYIGKTSLSILSDMTSQYMSVFRQAPNNEDYILSQYNIVAGDKIATEKNEVMLVIDSSSSLSDLTLGYLGFFTQEEFSAQIDKICTLEEPEAYKGSFSYEELLGKEFVWHSNDTVFGFDGEKFSYKPYYDKMVDENAVSLKVVSILQPKETIDYGCLSSGIYYTEALTNYVLACNGQSQIIKYLETAEKDAFKVGEFSFDVNYFPFYDEEHKTEEKTVKGYLGSMDLTSIITNLMAGDTSSVFDYLIGSITDGSVFTDGTAALSRLSKAELGGCTIPTVVTIYPTDFNAVQSIRSYLDQWNREGVITLSDGTILEKEGRSSVIYTDTLTMIIGIVNNVLNIITIALVAFTAISLVVSTAMIGIITYVSVVERVKEIGVLRSLGARKFDVSMLFTAETFIIGLVAGLIGVGVTYLVSMILNLVLAKLIGIGTLASLPITEAILMVVISVVLTLISGVLPASSAAKKDPVISLRTE